MLKAGSQKPERLSQAAAIERRAWVRFTSTLEASCQSKGTLKDAGWPGKVVDLSLGGIGLILRHRFPSGAPLTVELKTQSGRYPRSVSVRVVHTRPVVIEGNPCWFTGCAFARNLTEAELQELMMESG
ncbi:MAG TPA: PilZ domain-containing protein [Gemmataceae bacterium]|jgi:hypothetical protein|nr:PilZ domain-containing protein [Gemmataceae bacterium]